MFYTGEILLIPYTFVPAGFARCNGALFLISQYTALFSLLGIAHGGNGTTTFAVPNMTAPPNMMYVICLSDSYPSRP
jgi:microcystin-dependent protein